MKEIWKPIKDYEQNYQVSNFGNVRSFRNGKYRVLKPWKVYGIDKYLAVALCKEGVVSKQRLVHRLVAQTFIPNPENKPQVNHIDNDSQNNKLSNLEWVTPKENTHHTIKQGRHMHGERTNTAKLKVRDVIEIRQSSLSAIELSARFKVGKTQIYRIKRNMRWKNLE